VKDPSALPRRLFSVRLQMAAEVLLAGLVEEEVGEVTVKPLGYSRLIILTNNRGFCDGGEFA